MRSPVRLSSPQQPRHIQYQTDPMSHCLSLGRQLNNFLAKCSGFKGLSWSCYANMLTGYQKPINRSLLKLLFTLLNNLNESHNGLIEQPARCEVITSF